MFVGIIAIGLLREGTMQASTTDVVDPKSHDRRNQDLLVVTDSGNRGRDGLMLPFQEATVLELTKEDRPEIDGPFDKVVLDLRSYDASIVDAVVRALRPGADVMVMMPPTIDASADPLTFSHLTWKGVTTVGGRLGAVLSTTGRTAVGSDAVLSHMAAASAGYQLATQHAIDNMAELESRFSEAEAALAVHRDHRRHSEQALLNHIEALLQELDGERRRHRGIRLVHTVLQRHGSGRIALRLLRPFVVAARKLRRGAVAGRARLRWPISRARR